MSGPAASSGASASSGAVAAVDCGTNSTRLLVASGDGEPLARLTQITRLGRGVDSSCRISAEGIGRTVAALAHYRSVMDGHGVGRLRVTATSAARDATNAEELFDAAEAAVGARPELLSGEEEGRLSFEGATAELDPAGGPYLVADIGGGSTELVAGQAGAELAITSLDMGCVRLTERHLGHDPPLASELADARSTVRDLVDEAVQRLPRLAEAAALVGLAGTVASVVSMQAGLRAYDRDVIHHAQFERVGVEALLAALAAEGCGERRHRRGLEPERADVIVGGMVVLAVLMERLGYERGLASESDILDGLVMSQLT